ncbi:MAG: alpha-amylase family glycosyl hydrolase [Candidatus Cyclobacteriaceae bacterium M2_1C_046]
MYNILKLSGILLLTLSCTPKATETAKVDEINTAWPNGVAYEIFVQSFYDTNNDSIGDINGMIQKMDYLEELNIDAVWLMPIMPSPSYHKYDVTDYRAIHPDYGTMEEFKSFLAEAHERDIKVIIDFVVNHTSNQHPWFIAASSDKDSKYRDYYVWADKDSIAEQLAKKEISFDSDNIRQWHPVNGNEKEEHYYGFFWGGMPDLNFDNPEVKKEIYDIGRFWLEDVGVDGFRLDAAKHIFPDDRADDNHEFWKEFKAEMEKVDPDVYLVGEIWANAETTAPYAAGFTSFFNFDLAFSILESVNRGGVVDASISGHGWQVNEDSSFITSLIANRAIYNSINTGYHDAIFLSNHDQNRVMSVLNNDEGKAKVAASILLTLPGTPYIYYGEEIGMRGKKPDPRIREPFLWEEGNDPNRPKWIEPEYNTPATIESLSEQRKDSTSLFDHYKDLIDTRKSIPALLVGELIPFKTDDPSLLTFKRTYEGTEVLIIHNLKDDKNSLTLLSSYTLHNSFNGSASLTGNTIHLPPYSSVILAKD